MATAVGGLARPLKSPSLSIPAVRHALELIGDRTVEPDIYVLVLGGQIIFDTDPVRHQAARMGLVVFAQSGIDDCLRFR